MEAFRRAARTFCLFPNGRLRTRQLIYFVFDVLVLAGRDVTDEPLIVRRELLNKRILPKIADPIRHAPELRTSLSDLIRSVKVQGLVAKRRK